MEEKFDEDGRTFHTFDSIEEMFAFLKLRDNRPIEKFRPVFVMSQKRP